MKKPATESLPWHVDVTSAEAEVSAARLLACQPFIIYELRDCTITHDDIGILFVIIHTQSVCFFTALSIESPSTEIWISDDFP